MGYLTRVVEATHVVIAVLFIWAGTVVNAETDSRLYRLAYLTKVRIARMTQHVHIARSPSRLDSVRFLLLRHPR